MRLVVGIIVVIGIDHDLFHAGDGGNGNG